MICTSDEKGRPEDWTAALVGKLEPKPFLTASHSMKRCCMDSLSALNAFVRAAEFRSFTDAGRELRLSSSAICKAISRLEERHGVRLFNRSTRSITLTHEGQLLLDSCRRIFSEIENVEKEFAEAKSAPKGKLRVSMPPLGGVAASVLARFLREYPDIELDVDFAERPAEVIDGGYDVMVRAGEVDDCRLMSRRIGSYRPALVCSPGYLAQKAGTPYRAEDLIDHACLHLKDATTGKLQRWPFASPEMSDVSLQVTAVANSTEALIAFAELGMGIACVPDFTVHRQLADGSLQRILCGCLEQRGSLRAIWPSSRFPSPKLRAFINFLARHGFASSDCGIIDEDPATRPPERANATAPRTRPAHPIGSRTASTVISLNI